ncbi:hypothetical protein E3U26_20635 (plasmid) [Paracoccus ferrooxidans]|nr:hypothetical protein E3U26_20635 [Paracoccus ferrooxidans]
MPHLSIKNSDASNRLNDYIFSCTKSGYPSVVCKRYTKYADVDVMFDLSDSFSLSPYEARSKEILNAVSTIVEKHTSLRGGDNISLFDVHIGKREIPVAEALSAELHDYYMALVNSANEQSA